MILSASKNILMNFVTVVFPLALESTSS